MWAFERRECGEAWGRLPFRGGRRSSLTPSGSRLEFVEEMKLLWSVAERERDCYDVGSKTRKWTGMDGLGRPRASCVGSSAPAWGLATAHARGRKKEN